MIFRRVFQKVPASELSPWRRVAPHMWRRPDSPVAYGFMEVDASEAQRAIGVARTRSAVPVTLNHLAVKAVANALAAGRLERDTSLNLPPPPIQELPQEAPPPPRPVNVANAYQVQITGTDVNIYNFAMAHLRTLPGLESAIPQQINPTGIVPKGPDLTGWNSPHRRGEP